MSQAKTPNLLTRLLSLAIIAVLVLLPFHALLTTWVGSNFGYLDGWRIWKEVIITALVPFGLWLAYRTPDIRSWLRTSWLARLILIYLGLHVVLGMWATVTDRVTGQALLYGLFANLRYLGFFMICAVVAARNPGLLANWWRVLLWPAGLVIIFGLTQLFLPIDFLSHAGYGPETIPAYHTVDEKLGYQRIQSTLRGPNPLGAYLLVIIVAGLAWPTRRRVLKQSLLTLGFGALFFTYSRSAWLGLAAAITAYMFLRHHVFWRRHVWKLAAVGLGLIIITMLTLYTHRHNDRLENVLFHTNEKSQSEFSSNESRFGALKSGAMDLVIEPWGRGPGTAGPASARNDGRARISENYYVQLAQETGWFGLLLFIVINVMVGYLLWLRRREAIPLVLLSTLIGLSVVNLVSHAWADDTLGLLWWGLAGVALAPAIMNKKRKHNGFKKTTKARN